MKHFAKILLPLLILALMLSACGGESEKDVSGTVTPATEAVETTEAVNDTPVSMGRMEGGTYTNNYVGFAVDLDSTWTYYGAEELQDLPDNVAEIFEGTEIGENMDPLTQFTDMMAESVENMTSMNVLYQKLDMTERLLYAAMDNEAVLDSLLEQKDMMAEAYAAAGMEVQSMEKVTVNFLGQERPALKTMCDIQGVAYYTLQIFEAKLGQYSVTITFSSFLEDKTDSLAAMCYPVN